MLRELLGLLGADLVIESLPIFQCHSSEASGRLIETRKDGESLARHCAGMVEVLRDDRFDWFLLYCLQDHVLHHTGPPPKRLFMS